MEAGNRALLEEGLQFLGPEIMPTQVDAVVGHLRMVTEWNERINLTAITGEREMVIKHALDSALALKVVGLSAGMKVADIGTGAGFPGVVWKCLVPGIDLVLLESLQKRCKFLEQVGAEVIGPLAPKAGYRVVWSRAEDAGQSRDHREKYDVVTARAVADLRVLAEYCLPFTKTGGRFLAMKGPDVGAEVERAQRSIELLGGELESVEAMELPEGAGTRSFVLVRKVKPTPKDYPRKAGTPAKSPL